MRKKYIVLIALGVVVLLVGTFLNQALTIYPSQVIVKPAGSAIGIAPFTDRVDFGDVPQGSTVGKTLVLENGGTNSNQVYVFIMGGIGELVTVQPKSFTIAEGATQEVKFSLTMPKSADPEKKFSGRVLVLRLPKGF